MLKSLFDKGYLGFKKAAREEAVWRGHNELLETLMSRR